MEYVRMCGLDNRNTGCRGHWSSLGVIQLSYRKTYGGDSSDNTVSCYAIIIIYQYSFRVASLEAIQVPQACRTLKVPLVLACMRAYESVRGRMHIHTQPNQHHDHVFGIMMLRVAVRGALPHGLVVASYASMASSHEVLLS